MRRRKPAPEMPSITLGLMQGETPIIHVRTPYSVEFVKEIRSLNMRHRAWDTVGNLWTIHGTHADFVQAAILRHWPKVRIQRGIEVTIVEWERAGV